MLQKAKELCARVYYGQLDKDGNSYYSYLMEVADRCHTEEEKIVALLHKTVFDKHYSLESLAKLGFSRKTLLAIDALMGDDTLPHSEYINYVKSNEIARAVKIIDLEYLTDSARFKLVNTRQRKKYARFQKFLNILKGADDNSIS